MIDMINPKKGRVIQDFFLLTLCNEMVDMSTNVYISSGTSHEGIMLMVERELSDYSLGRG